MTANIDLAKDVARSYLEQKGYEIVDFDWEDSAMQGSIDVVAIKSRDILVFADVSASCWGPSAVAADTCDEPRRRRLAERWLAAHPEKNHDGKTMRFDKLYVTNLNGKGDIFLKHIVDMFHM